MYPIKMRPFRHIPIIDYRNSRKIFVFHEVMKIFYANIIVYVIVTSRVRGMYGIYCTEA